MNCNNEFTHFEQFAHFPHRGVSFQMIKKVHHLWKWVYTFWTIRTLSPFRRVLILLLMATNCENEFTLFEKFAHFQHSGVSSHMILKVHKLWKWVCIFRTVWTFSTYRSEFSYDSSSPPIMTMSLHILNNWQFSMKNTFYLCWSALS